MKILSSIIGMFRSWKKRVWDDPISARVESRAQRMFLKMLVLHEEDELKKKLEDLAVKKQLADAWMPFKPKKLTQIQEKLLRHLNDDDFGALEIVGEEVRADLSNRAMAKDGTDKDRAMWAAVGVRMYLDTLRERAKHYAGRHDREEVKKKQKRQSAPAVKERTTLDLMNNNVLHP